MGFYYFDGSYLNLTIMLTYEAVRMLNVPEAVNNRFKKYLNATQKKIVASKKRDFPNVNIQGLFKEIICKVFGFNKQSDLIDPQIDGNLCYHLGVQIQGETKYILEFSSPKMNISNENLHRTIEYCKHQFVEWAVRTNGFEWEIHKANCERPNVYDMICSFNFIDMNLENNEDLKQLYLLCKEAHGKTIITDEYNKNRWYGFLSEDKRTIDYMFLLNIFLYEDGSEKVYIPYLNVTYWCEDRFIARRNAEKAIDKHLMDEYGKTYDGEHRFETVAYQQEKTHMKTNLPIWW